MRVLVLHGPNLNLLGRREPHLYGDTTLDEIDAALRALAKELDVSISCKQSNHEGELIDRLHRALDDADAVLLNAGAYAHTSLALADAVRAIAPVPVVEVHLTNTAARGDGRERAVVGAACRARVEGFGWRSYLVALRAVCEIVRHSPADSGPSGG
jgi:3-dehydroquinate dehydratase-2